MKRGGWTSTRGFFKYNVMGKIIIEGTEEELERVRNFLKRPTEPCLENNVFTIERVTQNFGCSKQEAKEILNSAFDSDLYKDKTWFLICSEATNRGITLKTPLKW